MRVTNAILHNNFLFNLGRRREEQAKLQDQISSGKQFVRPSQDPLHIGRSLTLRNSIGLNNRLNENIQQAQTLANIQDDNLGQVNDILQRIRELAVRAANTHLSPEQYDAISREVEQMTDQVVTIGNYSNGEKFVFGGHQSHLPPFDARKDVVINGVDLTSMGLGGVSGTQVPVVQRIPARAVLAGAFAMPDGSLSINGYDLGAMNLPDTTRTSNDNAQSLADRINSVTDRTGVRGVVTAMGGGTFGVTLQARDGSGAPTGKEIAVAGTDIGGATGIYNGSTARNLVQSFAAGPVPAVSPNLVAGEMVINGIDIGAVDLTTGGPSQNQKAQRLVDAINAKSGLNGVSAATNTNGTLILSAIGETVNLTMSGNGPTITQFPAGSTLTSHVTAPAVVAAGPLSFGPGSLRLNGVDIFTGATTINNPTPQGNAGGVASFINAQANGTGVRGTTGP
ncbi:MAG: flagellar hook-associated protein FlgL, partial [Candidatus Sericytochromatia bacterium]|nr:flagellar hook-associated protein FlgL [Candidatus Sericytochromatia bacterium]